MARSRQVTSGGGRAPKDECTNGWLGEDDEGRPRPCLRCRPHPTHGDHSVLRRGWWPTNGFPTAWPDYLRLAYEEMLRARQLGLFPSQERWAEHDALVERIPTLGARNIYSMVKLVSSAMEPEGWAFLLRVAFGNWVRDSRQLTQLEWLEVFERFPYSNDLVIGPRPEWDGPLVLYRGAGEVSTALAWTPSLSAAGHFAIRHFDGENTPRVWKVSVTPEVVLARINHDWDEFVVDPRRIHPVEYDGPVIPYDTLTLGKDYPEVPQ